MNWPGDENSGCSSYDAVHKQLPLVLTDIGFHVPELIDIIQSYAEDACAFILDVRFTEDGSFPETLSPIQAVAQRTWPRTQLRALMGRMCSIVFQSGRMYVGTLGPNSHWRLKGNVAPSEGTLLSGLWKEGPVVEIQMPIVLRTAGSVGLPVNKLDYSWLLPFGNATNRENAIVQHPDEFFGSDKTHITGLFRSGLVAAADQTLSFKHTTSRFYELAAQLLEYYLKCVTCGGAISRERFLSKFNEPRVGYCYTCDPNSEPSPCG